MLYSHMYGQLLTKDCSVALESIRRENGNLKNILFEIFDSRPVNQESRLSLLLLLEKQDRNLEAQLLQIRKDLQKEVRNHQKASVALEKHRSTHSSVTLLHEQTALAEKKFHQLEDKRHKSLVDKGEAEHASKLIRGSIDSLRRERLLFEEVHRKKKKELLSIAHDVAEIVNEAIDRIEATKKSNVFLEQIVKSHKKGENTWSRAWREQILRIEEFTNQEIHAQRQMCASKRNKVMDMIQLGCDQISTQRKIGSSGITMSTINPLNGILSTVDRIFADDIDAVAMHIGARGPDHVADVVNAFESFRSSYLLQLQTSNARKIESMSPLIKREGEERDDPGSKRMQLSNQGQNSYMDISSLIHKIMNLARGLHYSSPVRCGEVNTNLKITEEEELLCMVSLLEIWVHRQMNRQ